MIPAPETIKTEADLDTPTQIVEACLDAARSMDQQSEAMDSGAIGMPPNGVYLFARIAQILRRAAEQIVGGPSLQPPPPANPLPSPWQPGEAASGSGEESSVKGRKAR
jgi:hypothetical protein